MKKTLIILILFITYSAEAQLTNFSEVWKEHEFKGDQLYNDGLYEAAIDAYQKQLVDDPENTIAIVRIAESYKHLSNYKMAGHYFHMLGRSFQLDEKYFEEYAEVLLAEGNKEEALDYFKKALEVSPNDKVLANRIYGIENWDLFYEYKDYAKVESTPFNSQASDFGIRKFGGGLAFTSSRMEDGIIQYNYLRESSKLTSMFIVESNIDNNPVLLELDNYRKSNDGPHASFGYDYILSRSFEIGNKSNTVLGLFFYEMDENGMLKEVKPFSFNSPQYSITHPAFNDRGDTLFFASDMPSGFGGYDLYYSVYRNNSWSAPINLGEPINTRKNELFPYSDNGQFYFASDGHAGIGGLDIYQLDFDKGLTVITNMGFPVNSGWDDFGIYISDSIGYISSNRPDGRGLDDIYKISLLQRPAIIDPVQVSLSVFDNLSELPIGQANVQVVSKTGSIEAISDKNGLVNQTLMPGEYTVNVSRELYADHSYNLVIEEGQLIEENVRLEPAMVVHLVSPDSIMFKFGEYNLLHEDADKELDAIAETLENHPEFNLEISAHTDSRGGKDYNQWLSERRAETAAKYIINKGINPSRIHQYGFGETKLLNNCKDGFRCSDKLHAVNRRLEFDFIRIEKKED